MKKQPKNKPQQKKTKKEQKPTQKKQERIMENNAAMCDDLDPEDMNLSIGAFNAFKGMRIEIPGNNEGLKTLLGGKHPEDLLHDLGTKPGERGQENTGQSSCMVGEFDDEDKGSFVKDDSQNSSFLADQMEEIALNETAELKKQILKRMQFILGDNGIIESDEVKEIELYINETPLNMSSIDSVSIFISSIVSVVLEIVKRNMMVGDLSLIVNNMRSIVEDMKETQKKSLDASGSVTKQLGRCAKEFESFKQMKEFKNESNSRVRKLLEQMKFISKSGPLALPYSVIDTILKFNDQDFMKAMSFDLRTREGSLAFIEFINEQKPKYN